jgi:hypothetical protein
MIYNLIVIYLIIALGLLIPGMQIPFVIADKTSRRVGVRSLYRKEYIILISIMLILQSGLRHWSVGSDTRNYYNWFERAKKMSWAKIFESLKQLYQPDGATDPGYNLFQKIVQLFINDYQVYLILVAIIFFAAFGNFIYKNSSRISDAMMAFLIYSVLFYAFFSITGIRQTIATSLALVSFEFIKKRKLVFFLIFIFLASTIHKSVLIFMPFYFAPMIKNVKFFYGATLLLFPFIFYFRERLTLLFASVSGYDEYEYFEGAGTPVFTFLMVLITVFSFMRYKYVVTKYPIANLFYFAIVIALVLTPLTWVNPSTMRVVQYFSIFMVLLIPKAISSFESATDELDRVIYVFFVISIILIYLLRVETEYKFFWQ